MIKVITDTKYENHGKSFPKLMTNRSSGLILLMTSDHIGTVISKGDSTWDVGSHHTGWLAGSFQDYNGKITLENE